MIDCLGWLWLLPPILQDHAQIQKENSRHLPDRQAGAHAPAHPPKKKA
jgi:hypothetical protein